MSNVMSARAALSGLLMVVATMFLSQSCGSSSGGNAAEITDLCNQSCTKTLACFPDGSAPFDAATCKSLCTSMATSDGGTCSNQAAIISAAKACLAMSDCTAYLACAQSIPKCNGGSSGQGGSTGGGQGGSTGGGQGGSTGTASCSVCDKAPACCTAVGGGSASQCAMLSTASCNAQSGAAQTQFVMGCQQILAAGVALNIAACK